MGLDAFDPGRRGVRALLIVAVVAAIVAGFVVARSRDRPTLVAPQGVDAVASASPGPPGSPGGELVVAVAGKVRDPGLVRLPAGARVADAIEAAGGALPGTDLALVNLARKLVDGELVLVGVVPSGAADAGGGAGPAGAASSAKVNLNTASLAELETLPGIGPVLAGRIVDYRTRQGGFRTTSDLRKVDGIGNARYEQLKELVTV